MSDPNSATLIARVAAELKLAPRQVEQAIVLLDEGNTVPFITRYRKERTGGLDEEQLRQIQQKVELARQLVERAASILKVIEQQGKLTPELKAEIERADSLKRLEDLYLPYRPKRRTRAGIARERGLEPIAQRIRYGQVREGDLTVAARAFVNPQQELPDEAAVLAGARDILAEELSEDATVRDACRLVVRQTGRLVSSLASKATDEQKAEFRDYGQFSEGVVRIPPHRILALNRGEKLDVLKVKLEWDAGRAEFVAGQPWNVDRHPCREFLQGAVRDSLDRLLLPALDREWRKELTEKAEQHAIGVFAKNLRNLLLQPPLRGRKVLAIDPGLRTGCKLAVLGGDGRVETLDVVYIVGSPEKRAEASRRLADILRTHAVETVAIGNGTACRETEEIVAALIEAEFPDVRYVIVNEAGASIYSASTVAREEFPDLDATARGTISIGRRLQDPLSELVKIEAQHLGVGMYQHDITPKDLKESLDAVVESCVNYVGVDLNSASAALLRYVSGLNQLLARRIVEHRTASGPFRRRQDLLEVAGVGKATFTQAAGFLKIAGAEPLDQTWIHPESYGATRSLLKRCAIPAEQIVQGKIPDEWKQQLQAQVSEATAQELGVGLQTLRDIVDALLRPGRDPRTDLPLPIFRKNVLTLDDLHEGMELHGTVLNVVDFGAFVDIGLKESALVHISQLSTNFVKNPHDVVAVGNIVDVWVHNVDRERHRVGLTMVPPEARR